LGRDAHGAAQEDELRYANRKLSGWCPSCARADSECGKVARVERRPDERRYLRGRPRQQPHRSGLIDLVFNGLDSPADWAGGLAATEVSDS